MNEGPFDPSSAENSNQIYNIHSVNDFCNKNYEKKTKMYMYTRALKSSSSSHIFCRSVIILGVFKHNFEFFNLV